MLSQLMQMLQSLMGYQSCGNERFFQNANGASTRRSASLVQRQPVEQHGVATGSPQLISFPGGFQISTQTTPPNGKGVTWNRSATVALNGGATTVTLGANGEPSITSNGQSLAIVPGQTLQLGNGETVAANANGSLCVTARNGDGGTIVTTLTARNNGVDVDVTAHDVELGGALVNGANNAQRSPLWPPQAFPN